MARIPKLTEEFLQFFHSYPQHVFHPEEFEYFLKQLSWKTSIPPQKLLQTLEKQDLIGSIALSNDSEEVKLYAKADASVYEIAVNLQKEAYISHYTAALLNHLAKEHSPVIYVTWPQKPKQRKENFLNQESIDHAFSGDQRISGRRFSYNEHTIVLLNGMATGKEGVRQASAKHPYDMTNIERTLIDVTVRPAYAGGAMAIAEMYKRALKKISFEELLGIFNSISFIYPYHQALGFYLQRAGYNGSYLDELKKKGMDYDFYLDYNMQQKSFSKEWRIYYPSAMDAMDSDPGKGGIS